MIKNKNLGIAIMTAQLIIALVSLVVLVYGMCWLLNENKILTTGSATENEVGYLVNDIYPDTMGIVALDRENNIVTIENWSGVQYQFYGCEDYCVGDVVSVLMADNGTRNIYDDMVLDANYCAFGK